MEVAWGSLQTPIGPVTVGATSRGVIRVSFGALAEVAGGVPLPEVHDPARLEPVGRQILEYLAGARRRFDLPLDWGLVGGFGRDVVQTLYRTVGYGQVVTYQELADRVGQPNAARAVGAALGSNPIPIVVPCHRVVAADGLGGYGGGLTIKRALLELEGVLPVALF
jgi:methylated-DNA-[protein]-cysteine S-methyltransferase